MTQHCKGNHFADGQYVPAAQFQTGEAASIDSYLDAGSDALPTLQQVRKLTNTT